jgi:hypothetical protein
VTPRGASRVTACTPAEARTRRQQARAFLDVAELVLGEPSTQMETHVSAALSVLAAIAASDAICGLRLGRYSRGQDHDQAVALLAAVDLADGKLPGHLRRLLTYKDTAHYSPRLVSRSDAQALVRQARILVEAAESL